MTIRKHIKLTPEAFVSAPRRTPAVPNADGTLALYTVSGYSLETHTANSQIRILHLQTGGSILFSDDPKKIEPIWLGYKTLLWLKEGNDSATEIWCGDAAREETANLVGIFPGRATNPKIVRLAGDVDGSVALLLVARCSSDGSLANKVQAKSSTTSARLYDEAPIRVWDHYMLEERYTIWYTKLEQTAPYSNQYRLSGTGFVNALKGTDVRLEEPDESGGPNYEVSSSGIMFTTSDPESNRAADFRKSLYYIQTSTFDEDSTLKPLRVSIPPFLKGTTSSPVFSPDGTHVAFLKTKSPDNTNDKSYICIVSDTRSKLGIQAANTRIITTSKDWDLQPSAVAFSSDNSEIYFTAQVRGRNVLFKDKWRWSGGIVPLEVSGSVTAFHVFASPRVVGSQGMLVSHSSFMDSSSYSILEPSSESTRLISSQSARGPIYGLQQSQVSEIYFKGAGDYDVQAFVVRPSSFDENKVYPLLFWVHGGPVSSWMNAWGTRWNPAVFAEQGYVVVMPNPTGSTGFGQDFVEGIVGNWGKRCYEDLVNCFEYIKNEMQFVDTNRAIAMGGSFGGYMMNWIQGHPFASSFRALINHDGIFSLPSMLASDEAHVLRNDLRGNLWDDDTKNNNTEPTTTTTTKPPTDWTFHDPSNYTQHWNTPMLIIHSDKDYRCPITEGLAAFHVLKAKGVECRFLNFPDEGHFVSGRENWLQWHRVVLEWCGKFCGEEGEDGVRVEGKGKGE